MTSIKQNDLIDSVEDAREMHYYDHHGVGLGMPKVRIEKPPGKFKLTLRNGKEFHTDIDPTIIEEI